MKEEGKVNTTVLHSHLVLVVLGLLLWDQDHDEIHDEVFLNEGHQ